MENDEQKQAKLRLKGSIERVSTQTLVEALTEFYNLGAVTEIVYRL